MIRQEQCDKVCRILDDVLANRPRERDSLIVAVRKAFDALEKQRWIPCSEKLPEKNGVYIVSYEDAVTFLEWFNGKWFFYPSNPAREETGTIIAWMPLPEIYQEGGAE